MTNEQEKAMMVAGTQVALKLLDRFVTAHERLAVAAERLVDAHLKLAKNTRAIAHGGESGPTGLELLSMAIAGTAPFDSSSSLAGRVSAAIDGIVVGLEEDEDDGDEV